MSNLEREDLLFEEFDDRFNAVLLLDVVHEMFQSWHEADVQRYVVDEISEFIFVLEKILRLDDL